MVILPSYISLDFYDNGMQDCVKSFSKFQVYCALSIPLIDQASYFVGMVAFMYGSI